MCVRSRKRATTRVSRKPRVRRYVEDAAAGRTKFGRHGLAADRLPGPRERGGHPGQTLPVSMGVAPQPGQRCWHVDAVPVGQNTLGHLENGSTHDGGLQSGRRLLPVDPTVAVHDGNRRDVVQPSGEVQIIASQRARGCSEQPERAQISRSFRPKDRAQPLESGVIAAASTAEAKCAVRRRGHTLGRAERPLLRHVRLRRRSSGSPPDWPRASARSTPSRSFRYGCAVHRSPDR